MANSMNDNSLMEQDGQFWSWYQLEQGQWRSWRSGQLNLQLVIEQDEILLKAEYREDDGDRYVTGRPDSSDRYITSGAGRIGLLPAMPDRPLVLKPRIPRRIPPGVQVQLMFFIPVWIQVLLEKKGGNVLLNEYPSVILSSTWFGDNPIPAFSSQVKAAETFIWARRALSESKILALEYFAEAEVVPDNLPGEYFHQDLFQFMVFGDPSIQIR